MSNVESMAAILQNRKNIQDWLMWSKSSWKEIQPFILKIHFWFSWRWSQAVLFMHSRFRHEWGSIKERRVSRLKQIFLLLCEFRYLEHVRSSFPFRELTLESQNSLKYIPSYCFKDKKKKMLVKCNQSVNQYYDEWLLIGVCKMLALIESAYDSG